MTYGKIIILIGIVVGMFLFQKTKPNLLKGILVGLIISFGISFFDNQVLTNISFFSFGIFSLTFGVYSGINKKWLYLIIGLFAFISFLFKLMHYPFANELKLLMLLPIVSYLLTFKKLESHKTGLSIASIFVAYELTEFIKLVELWIK